MRRGVAQFGSALEWGSRGRKFDSCHSDQKKLVLNNGFFLYLNENFAFILFNMVISRKLLDNKHTQQKTPR